jgi:hypothetical protein
MNTEEFNPYFVLGFVDNNPAVKIIQEHHIDSVKLAALTTTLFEAIMRSVPEEQQVQFEHQFTKAFAHIMKERFNYDLKFEFVEEDDDNE